MRNHTDSSADRDRGARMAAFGLVTAAVVVAILAASLILAPPPVPTGDGRTVLSVVVGLAGLACLVRAERTPRR